MDIPAVKGWPSGAAQCHECGGHGCYHCGKRGWYPPKTQEERVGEALLEVKPPDPRRKCENGDCSKFIEPDCVAVYCSNDCAADDA